MTLAAMGKCLDAVTSHPEFSQGFKKPVKEPRHYFHEATADRQEAKKQTLTDSSGPTIAWMLREH